MRSFALACNGDSDIIKNLENSLKVSAALFESYLYIRKGSWGLDINDPEKSHLEETATDKIKFCVNVINEMQSASTFAQYLKVLYMLKERETLEARDASKIWRSFDLFGMIYDIPVLLETIRAARAYLVSQLKNEEERFKKNVALLKSELAELIREEKEALDAKKPDETIKQQKSNLEYTLADLENKNITVQKCNDYFNQITKVRDSRVAVLQEKAFADFEKNVLQKKRILDEKMMHSAKVASGCKLVVHLVAVQPPVTPIVAFDVKEDVNPTPLNEKQSEKPANPSAETVVAPSLTWAERLGIKTVAPVMKVDSGDSKVSQSLKSESDASTPSNTALSPLVRHSFVVDKPKPVRNNRRRVSRPVKIPNKK